MDTQVWLRESDRAPIVTTIGQIGGPVIYGPKTPRHPTVGVPCPVCTNPLRAGDRTVLVALGPSTDHDAMIARSGLDVPFRAIAIEVHAACAGRVRP